MSIETEIERIQNAKEDIKTSIENKGVSVPSSAKIDTYSSYVDQIETGSGTTVIPNPESVEFTEGLETVTIGDTTYLVQSPCAIAEIIDGANPGEFEIDNIYFDYEVIQHLLSVNHPLSVIYLGGSLGGAVIPQVLDGGLTFQACLPDTDDNNNPIIRNYQFDLFIDIETGDLIVEGFIDIISPGGSGDVEGNDVKSTGEAPNKILTSDGKGGAKWQYIQGSSKEAVPSNPVYYIKNKETQYEGDNILYHFVKNLYDIEYEGYEIDSDICIVPQSYEEYINAEMDADRNYTSENVEKITIPFIESE